MQVRDTTEQWLKNIDDAALEKWLVRLMINSNEHRIS
jgi:hypothetical protein